MDVGNGKNEGYKVRNKIRLCWNRDFVTMIKDLGVLCELQ